MIAWKVAGNHNHHEAEELCLEPSRQLNYSMLIFHRADFSASGATHMLLWALCTMKTLLGKELEDQPLESALSSTLVEIIAAFFLKLQALEVTTSKICDRHLTLRNPCMGEIFYIAPNPQRVVLLTNKGKLSKAAGVHQPSLLFCHHALLLGTRFLIVTVCRFPYR